MFRLSTILLFFLSEVGDFEESLFKWTSPFLFTNRTNRQEEIEREERKGNKEEREERRERETKQESSNYSESA